MVDDAAAREQNSRTIRKFAMVGLCVSGYAYLTMPQDTRDALSGNATAAVEFLTTDPMGAGTYFWEEIVPRSRLLSMAPWFIIMKFAAYRFKRRAEAKWDAEEAEANQQKPAKGASGAKKSKRK